MRVKRMLLMSASGVLLTLSLTGCSTAPSADCAWVKRIITNSDDVLTRPTKEQITAHNLKVQQFCR